MKIFSQQPNMSKILVKLLILCGNLILSHAALTITDICSECEKCNGGESCCKSCLPKDENLLKSRGNILLTSDVHECSFCVNNNEVHDDDCNVHCEKCTACNSIYGKDPSLLIKNNNTDSPLVYVGSALGGVVFGSIVTSFVCIYLRRRSHKDRKRIRKQETGVHQIRNYTQHCLSKPLDQGHGNSTNAIYSEIEDKKRHSKDLFQKTPIGKSQTIDDTNDGVYNHLNETDRDAADRSEYYDHVTPLEGSSINVPTPSHGYGIVTVVNDGNAKRSEDGESIDDNDKSSENAAADEYFVLEKVQ